MIRIAILMLAMMAADTKAEQMRVGVRPDAVSMSYEVTEAKRGGASRGSGPLANAGFDGFVVRICDEVLTEMQDAYGATLDVEAVPVMASEIWDKLRKGQLDVVCGPTTATKERLRGLIASPPVFISGVSYASRANQDANACTAIAGVLRSSTASTVGLRTIIASNVWPTKDANVLVQFLSGGADWKTYYKDCDEEVEPMVAFDTHDAMADALCAGHLKYYVGDAEIIGRSLQAAKNRIDGSCDFIVSDRTFSEERYVILGLARSGTEAGSDPLVAHFFEILSRKLFFQPSAIDYAFENSFPFAEPSRKLEFLFWALRGNRE